MRLIELAFACYVFHASGQSEDDVYDRFVDLTDSSLNLNIPDHRDYLLSFLNHWGCRQFAIEHHTTAAAEIGRWYKEEVDSQFIDVNKTLLDLSEQDFNQVREVYEKLATCKASDRNLSDKIVPVKIGPTGAAKILFALRPNALVPWDEQIRKHFNVGGSASSYIAFLRDVKERIKDLERDCCNIGHDLRDVPQLLRRPRSSLAKLIDEYHWITITKQCHIPPDDQIREWAVWSQI